LSTEKLKVFWTVSSALSVVEVVILRSPKKGFKFATRCRDRGILLYLSAPVKLIISNWGLF
jgi:hypothetical protein